MMTYAYNSVDMSPSHQVSRIVIYANLLQYHNL